MDLILQAVELRFPLIRLNHLKQIHPGDFLPAVASNCWYRAHGFVMSWGYPDETRKKNKLIESVWIETCEKKLIFYDGIFQRRCLIPVSSFLIDGKNEQGSKMRYRVRHAEDEIFYLAAIYRKKMQQPYAVLLTAAVDDDFAVCKRMPIAVPRYACADWVNPRRRIKDKWKNWKRNWIFTEVQDEPIE